MSLDLEQTITSLRGLNEGYDVEQTEATITVTVAFPDTTNPSGIISTYTPQDNAVLIGVMGLNPVVCGILYGPVVNAQNEIHQTTVKMTFTKEFPCTWPVLIVGESPRGIDPKSIFLLGVEQDAMRNHPEALQFYQESAQHGFNFAHILLADIYLSDTRIYGTIKDPHAALEELVQVHKEYLTEEIVLTMADLYAGEGDIDSGIEALRSIKQPTEHLRFEIAKRLSPFYGGNQPGEAVEILQQLSDEGNSDAMMLLSRHLQSGYGVRRDKRRARNLKEHASKIGGLTLDEPKGNRRKWIAMGVSFASLVLIGVCGLRWKLRR